MRKRRKMQRFKTRLALALAGFLALGQTGTYGNVGGYAVQAAENTKITSFEYYDAENGESYHAESAKAATFGFVMPKFNGKPSSELALPDVKDDLTLYVKQAGGTGGEWKDIEKCSYFQFNQTWGWENQDWGGWICWFKVEETTELEFRSNSKDDARLHYILNLTKLDSVRLTSVKINDRDASPAGAAGISVVDGNIIYNGNPQIQHSQVEEYFNKDNVEVFVKRDSEEEFVPLFNNFAAGWQYDNNFGIYTNDGGGLWFNNLEESITLIFHSKEGYFPDATVRINYSVPERSNFNLAAVSGITEFDAKRDDHSGVIGMCLPRIGGTDVLKRDLDKFVYEIKDNGQWKNLGDVWLYRENGYSSLSDRTQWGYSVNDLWELWFKPVKSDAELRIGFPENGQKGGAINENYVYYHFIGDTNAVIPDTSDMDNITVDNSGTNGDVDEKDVKVPAGWTMIWNDEFNGTELDSTKWWNQTGYLLDENDYNTYGWGNNELEYYTDSDKNTSVHDGSLNLTLLKESKEFSDTNGNKVTAKYSSGKVLSQNKFSVKYGRVDFRAKLPDGQGIWPALWMMPNEDKYGTWARSGELDVMEGRGRLPDIAFGTLHYGDTWPGDKEDGLTMSFSEHGLTNMTDWHVYSVVWEEDNIKIYCDGICYYKGTNQTWYSAGAYDNPNAPFDIQYYLIMNLAAGGYFDGLLKPEEDVNRKDMYVDYVRVYQKKAKTGDPDADEDGLYGDYNSESHTTPVEGDWTNPGATQKPAGPSATRTPGTNPGGDNSQHMRDDYGAEIKGNDVVFYLKADEKPVPFYIKLDSKDSPIDETKVPATKVEKNGDYYECVIPDAAADKEQWYGCWFNVTYTDKLVFKIGDLEAADDNSENNGNPATTPPDEDDSQATTPPGEDDSQATTPPDESDSQATTPPGEDGSQATTPPGEDGNQGTTPPDEGGSQATTPPDESSSQATTPPGEDSSQATTPPGEDGNQGTTPPGGDDNPGTAAPGGDGSQGTTPPGGDGSQMTTPPGGNGNQGTNPGDSDQNLQDQIAQIANQYNVSKDTLKLNDKTIKSLKNDNDVKGSTFGLLQARAQKQTKNSVKLKWNKVKGADGYLVYGNKCGKKNSYKLITTTKKTSYTHKKLKKSTFYKYLVLAYKNVSGTKVTIAASKTIHTVTTNGKYGVAKKVTVKKSTVSLKRKKTFNLKGKEIKDKKPIKKHRALSYESSNTGIATVSRSGKIKGVKAGTCYVYAYAQNGVYKRVKVKVK